MSPFWVLLELRMMELVVTTGAIRHKKPRSNYHHQQTNIQFLLAGIPRMPFLSPNQHHQTTEGKKQCCTVLYKISSHISHFITELEWN